MHAGLTMILTEIASSGVSGFVQELYGEEVKKYHFDDLKTFCPRAENSPQSRGPQFY